MTTTTTLDDFYGDTPNDDQIHFPVIEPEYPPAPATGRYSRCWTTFAIAPKVGDLIISGAYTWKVAEVGEWEKEDAENGIEEAGYYVKLVSPLAA